MRAASAATAARLAASGTITPGARPIAYTVLSEQLLTNASQAGLLSGSAALTTATATAPGGQSSYIHATGNGYSSGSRYAFAFNGPWDFTNAFFRFQLRCQLYGLTQGYFVRFATSKTAHDAGNFLEIKVAPGNAAPNWLFPNTWVYDSFDPLLMTAYGSGAALSSIGCIAFASQDASSSQTCDWDFAKIQRVQKAGTKAKCIIWHDDSVASGFAAIKTKLDAYGWAGSEANEWAGMDTGGTFMGAADLTKAKLSTWSIGTHAASSSEHVAVTATQFANQVLRSRLAARKYGLAGDAADFAYWGNMTANDTVYQDIHPQIQRAYRSGRWNTSKLTQPETQPPGDPHIMKGFLVDSAQTFITNWKPLLDNAVLTKGIAQFVFHQQIGSDSTQAAEFDSMLAWLDANRANIDVLSIDAAVTPLLSGYTPSTAVPTILTLTATPGNAQIVLNRSGGFGERCRP